MKLPERFHLTVPEPPWFLPMLFVCGLVGEYANAGRITGFGIAIAAAGVTFVYELMLLVAKINRRILGSRSIIDKSVHF
jgi:hypothetical protein